MITSKTSQYFPKAYEPFGGDIDVKVDLSNYATKTDLKNATHVDTSSFTLKTNLASLKTEVDKLDVDVVKNDVVKKTIYDKLVGKFFFSILNIYTCKHKIYNHQSYIYLICLGIKKTHNDNKN